MNNDALVAALGVDAVAAVHGYRRLVVGEAGRRGLRLVGEPLSQTVRDRARAHVIDPIDIRLAVPDEPGRPGLVLRWGPAHGWSVVRRRGHPRVSYLAGAGAEPIRLVPTAAEVVAWVTGRLAGPTTPPAGVELDDDPRAIRRLLGFIGAPRAQPMYEASRPLDRPPARRAG